MCRRGWLSSSPQKRVRRRQRPLPVQAQQAWSWYSTLVSPCWRQVMVPVSKQQDSGFIPEKTGETPRIFKQSMAGTHALLAVRLKVDSDGPVNVATNFPWHRSGWRRCLRRFLVADSRPRDVGGHRTGPRSEPCERTDNIQCRRMFLLPRRARSARSLEAQRRARDPLTVRAFLFAERRTRPP